MSSRNGKAYAVSLRGSDTLVAIHWEESEGKARYACLLSSRDAGYDLDFKDLKVVRAPELDDYDGQWPSGTRADLVYKDAGIEQELA